MDVTDLAAAPFVLVARWIWHRAAAPNGQLRRAWGRALLGVGIVASMATSRDIPFSEEFRGTHFLTEENPSVELAASFQINGDDEEIEGGVWIALDVLSFGESASADESAIVVTKTGTGQGTITLSLQDPESGPVEVRWTAYAEGSAADCTLFCFGSSGERVPTLIIDAPPDTFGPRPITLVELRDDRPELFSIDVMLPAGDSGISARVGRLDDTRVVVRHEGADYPLGEFDNMTGERKSTLLPRPSGCNQGCLVELQLSALPGRQRNADDSIEFYSAPNDDGEEASATLARINLESTVVTRTMTLPSVTVVRTEVTIPIAVALPQEPQFGDILRIRPILGDAVESFYDISVWPESTRTLESAPDRCFRGSLAVTAFEGPEDGSLPPADATAQIRVVYRSAESIGEELLVGIGEDAAEIC